jgi:hypothetical protein
LEVAGRGRPLSSTGGPTQGFSRWFLFPDSEARQREPANAGPLDEYAEVQRAAIKKLHGCGQLPLFPEYVN